MKKGSKRPANYGKREFGRTATEWKRLYQNYRGEMQRTERKLKKLKIMPHDVIKIKDLESYKQTRAVYESTGRTMDFNKYKANQLMPYSKSQAEALQEGYKKWLAESEGIAIEDVDMSFIPTVEELQISGPDKIREIAARVQTQHPEWDSYAIRDYIGQVMFGS